jgi:hypothetical protein
MVGGGLGLEPNHCTQGCRQGGLLVKKPWGSSVLAKNPVQRMRDQPSGFTSRLISLQFGRILTTPPERKRTRTGALEVGG